MLRRIPYITLALCTVSLLACTTPPPLDKSAALWRITNTCVKNQETINDPSPCEYVNLEDGYVVLKDIVGRTQFLVIPSKHISGIESPDILEKNATNYWQAAWRSREYVIDRAGNLSRQDIGMAVNSQYGRTQNQLHIHIDCLKPEVIDTLKENKNKLAAGKWMELRFAANLHSYQAKYIKSMDLNDVNPFKVLAAKAKEDMDRETLAVAAMEKGFVLLSDTADGAHINPASSEELLDHSCRIAEEEFDKQNSPKKHKHKKKAAKPAPTPLPSPAPPTPPTT